MSAPVVACVDVGKTVGWAWVAGTTHAVGSRLDELIDCVAVALRRGERVALGFECPLYFPVRSDPDAALRARSGEGNRPWASAAGSAALVAGLGQADAVLTRIGAEVPGIVGTTRWREFTEGAAALLIWEAFITGTQGDVVALPADLAPSATADQKDALTGALVFRRRIDAGTPTSDLQDEPVRSLAALHLLASGLSTDRTLLCEGCLVVKARKAA